MKRIILIHIILLLALHAVAESVSGPFRGALVLSSESENTIEITIEEIFSLQIDGDAIFLKGFDLELRIPPALAQYRDSFALYVYQGVTPSPSQAIRRYTGEELGFSVLPPARRHYIRYVFDGETANANDPDIQLFKSTISLHKLPVLFSIIPVMKGIPNSLYREKVTVIAKPVLRNTGALSLSMGNEFPVEVKIDETIKKGPWNKILLSAGMHTIEITSDHYVTISKQIGIERGNITELSIELEKKVPKVTFEIPESAQVYLDGTKILEPAKSREIKAGEHVVVISIGDYSLTQTLTVEAGRTYHIQLLMDIAVKVD